MNTIMADMAIPSSTGNGAASSKAGSESGEFGEIMKAQSSQNKKNPDAAAKKEEQDKNPANVGENVEPGAEGMAENQQMLNTYLIPGMPIPQIVVVDVNAGTAEDGAIQANQAEAAQTVNVPDAGAVKTPELTQAAENPVDAKGDSAVNDLPGAIAGESNQEVFNFRSLQPADMKAVPEVPQDMETKPEQKAMTESLVKPEEAQTSTMPGTDIVKPQGRQAEENTRSEKETSVYDKQDMSYIQDMAARGNAAASESTAAVKSGAKTDIRAEYMEQLKANIAESLASGKQEFEIQLNPANLGKLVIKASYEAGKAVISIVCSEARTMEAMSHQARELAAMVEDRTGNQTIVVVEHPAEDYLQQQGNQQENQQENHSGKQQNEEKNTAFSENLDFLQQLRLGLA